MNQIKRYTDVVPEANFDVPPRDEIIDAALDAVLERHLGPCPNVFHELISQTVHLDLYPYRPPGRDELIVMTRGISDQATTPPPGANSHQWIELFVRLPGDWPVPDGSQMPDERWWPFKTIKMLGRFVHAYHTWFAPLHTIPNGDPAQPYANDTAACGVLLIEPEGDDAPLARIDAAGRIVQCLEVIPITAAEMAWKLAHGAEPLIARLRAAGVIGKPFQVGRASVVAADEPPPESGDGGSSRFLAAAAVGIRDTRDTYAKAQRGFGFLERWRCRLTPPAWLPRDDQLRMIYRDEWTLRSQGKVVWGHIVQANALLFEPGPNDHPAAVLYSPDPWFDDHLDVLAELAEGLFEVKGTATGDAELQRFADLLEDELERQMRLPIPKRLTQGREVYYTTIVVHRRQLPKPLLRAPFFPLLIAPRASQAAIILHQRHWSPMLRHLWNLAGG